MAYRLLAGRQPVVPFLDGPLDRLARARPVQVLDADVVAEQARYPRPRSGRASPSASSRIESRTLTRRFGSLTIARKLVGERALARSRRRGRGSSPRTGRAPRAAVVHAPASRRAALSTSGRAPAPTSPRGRRPSASQTASRSARHRAPAAGRSRQSRNEQIGDRHLLGPGRRVSAATCRAGRGRRRPGAARSCRRRSRRRGSSAGTRAGWRRRSAVSSSRPKKKPASSSP